MKARAWTLGLLLFGLMAAHAVLETARDALFLSRVGSGHLASAYLAIAVCALVAITAVRRWGAVRSPRRALIGFLALASGGTAAFAFTRVHSPAVVFMLYIWTGLVATLAVPALWTVVDRAMRVGDAKKLFGRIGAGGVLGALAGSATAAGMSRLVAAQHLITVAAVLFAATTLAAVAIAPEDVSVAPAKQRRRAERHGMTKRYTHWLLLAALLATVTLTLGDLMFKRIVAERFADRDLALAFGTIYTGLNVLGLIVQVVATHRLLERFGVGGALTVLPLIVLLTVLGFAFTGAAIAIIALKLGDGALRHSLHRIATEILFLPLAERVREAARPIIEVVGQRGGQMVAAGIALAAGGTGALAAVITVAALAWIATIAFTRRAYVRQFRDTLDAGEIQRDVRIPTLDSDAISMLTSALASPDETEALAALDILARRGDDVPALVLYHPSAAVVRRALGLLQTASKKRRPDLERVLAHLTTHADAHIRAAALAVSSATGLHVHLLEAALEDAHPDVRAAAIVGLDKADAIAEMARGTACERAALARAIARAPQPRHRKPLLDMLAIGETTVTREVLRVWAIAPELAEPDKLLAYLEDPHVRGDARRVFAVAGYFDRLIEALDDPRTSIGVRRHLPRTISRFNTPAAAAALVSRLVREPDGTTEFKILRALGRMRSNNPTLALDTEPVLAFARRSIDDAARYAALAVSLEQFADREGDLGAILLLELLDEKRRYAIERVFRALGIAYPRGDLRSVYDGIASDDEDRRAAAREVLEDLVAAPLRIPLVALLDNANLTTHANYDAVIAALLADPSDSLRSIAEYHVNNRENPCATPFTAFSSSVSFPALPTQISTSWP